MAKSVKAEADDGAMPEPSGKKQWAELEKRLMDVLSGADLSSLTTKLVRKQLEGELGLSLASESSRQWIKDKINEFVEKQAEAAADDDGEEEEEEEAPAAKKRKAAPKPAAAKRKRANAGGDDDDDLVEDPAHPPLSDQMAAIVGMKRASRFRLVKLLWVYIKGRELQDPADKRVIRCDEKLRAAFGQETVTAFSMAKYLGPHILAAEGGPSKPSKPAKSAPAVYTGSAALAAFCGEETNNRFQITKHVWDHIKAHGLQSDPADKRRIILDDKLRALFGVDEMTSFSLAKHIGAHFPKK